MPKKTKIPKNKPEWVGNDEIKAALRWVVANMKKQFWYNKDIYLDEYGKEFVDGYKFSLSDFDVYVDQVING